MATCACPMPIPVRTANGEPLVWRCSNCNRPLPVPDPRDAEIARLKAEVERHLRCTSSYPEKQAACARKDDEIARLRDIIVELERWKSAAQLAWSICVETAPEDCPGPDAVRAEVDALDDRCIAAEGQVLVAATLAPKDPPPGVVVSDLARRFNRAMGRQEWSADGVRAAAVVERALAAGPARIRDNYPLSDHWAADVVEAAQEAALKGKP